MEEQFSFCPYCGNSFLNPQKEKEDFGMLGRNDYSDSDMDSFSPGFGITDKLIGSIMKSMMKNLDKQFKDMEKDFDKNEVRTFPNGIRIKIAGPFDRKQNKAKKVLVKRTIDEDQMKRMSSLPRAKAKTSVKRIGDKVIYELSTPGVSSPQDIFISKLESGYEIKVIGSKKVYVNNVPINLPLKRYSILKNKLLVEFNTQEE